MAVTITLPSISYYEEDVAALYNDVVKALTSVGAKKHLHSSKFCANFAVHNKVWNTINPCQGAVHPTSTFVFVVPQRNKLIGDCLLRKDKTPNRDNSPLFVMQRNMAVAFFFAYQLLNA